MPAQLIELLRAAVPSAYVVEQPVGTGGQGAVFRGTRSGVPCAIKVFAPGDPKRIDREVAALKKVQCPHLVKLVDFQIMTLGAHPCPVVAYDYVAGPNLRQVLSSQKLLDGPQVIQLGKQIGEAVEALWRERIVHRDIKPENIVAAADGTYVLVDLGLAQHLDLSTITQAGGQPGTSGYRSPEQFRGRKKLTVHADVFSLGVTAFEVATGHHPWDRDQVAMVTTSPKSFLALRPDIDSRVASLLHEMLRMRPAERPTNPSGRFAQLIGGA